MNIKEAVEYCKTHNARIHTPTRETYDKLMEYLEEQGYRWGATGKLSEYDGYKGDKTRTFEITGRNVYWECIETSQEGKREIIEITPDTFTEKLEKFIAGDIVFHVDSWELCEELAKVFDAKGLRGSSNDRIPLMVLKDAWYCFGTRPGAYVRYYEYLRYGPISSLEFLNKLTTVTLKEVQEYLNNTKPVISTQKVTVRTPEATLEFQANVTQTTDGLLIEQLVEPKFSIGNKVYTATAKVGTVVSIGKRPRFPTDYVYGITWVNGTSSTHILEEHLTKLEELL